MFDLPPVEQVECMTEAIYHEARGESYYGQLLVGFVIMNRVNSSRFPDSICEVVYQPSQFSYATSDRIMYNPESEQRSRDVAEIVLTSLNPTPHNMMYYHAINALPNWDYSKLSDYAVIGNHKFYADR